MSKAQSFMKYFVCYLIFFISLATIFGVIESKYLLKIRKSSKAIIYGHLKEKENPRDIRIEAYLSIIFFIGILECPISLYIVFRRRG